MHQSVLLNEVVRYLRPMPADGTIVDATVGLGGHAEALLREYPEARLLGIDRDEEALSIARERLAPFAGRVSLVEGRHESLIDILKQQEVMGLAGLLADLGVSSLQLDDARRGFSFRFEAPLDMRMGRGDRQASEVVNTMDGEELESVLRRFGEEPMARRIARAIVAARSEGPIETTTQLADIVRGVKHAKFGDIDPATLTFQAIRIAANEELVGLDHFIDDAVSLLEPGARVAIISFHSLEDRIVKRAFRRLEGECTCPPNLPICACGAKSVVTALTHRPVVASSEEVAANPRARSAKLRVAEKVEDDPM
jgi:16S rRNA (cytosine1402-N4)-methyltransferase